MAIKRLAILLSLALVGTALLVAGYFSMNTCYIDGQFYNLNDDYVFKDETNHTFAARCQCAGKIGFVKNCVYNNTEVAPVAAIKSELGTVWYASVHVEARDKITAQSALFFTNSKLKAPLAARDTSAVAGITGSPRVFKSTSLVPEKHSIKQQVDFLASEIKRRKKEYCFRAMQLESLSQNGAKLVDKAKLLTPDQVVEDCLRTPGRCTAATSHYAGSCENEKYLLMAFDCYRGECSKEFRDAPESFELPKQACLPELSACAAQEVLQTACLGQNESCKEYEARNERLNRKAQPSSRRLDTQWSMPEHLPAEGSPERAKLIETLVSQRSDVSKPYAIEKIQNITADGEPLGGWKFHCPASPARRVIYGVQWSFNGNDNVERIEVELGDPLAPYKLLLLSLPATTWKLTPTNKNHFIGYMSFSHPGESQVQANGLTKLPLPPETLAMIERRKDELRRPLILEEIARQIWTETDPTAVLLTESVAGRRPTEAVKISLPKIRDAKFLCDLQNESTKPLQITKINRSELPCYLVVRNEGISTSKSCPERFPPLKKQVLGSGAAAYSPKQNRYYAVNNNALVEIDPVSGEANVIKSEGDRERWSWLASLAVDTKRDRVVVTTNWHSANHWLVELEKQTIALITGESRDPLNPMGPLGIIKGNVAYNAEMDRFLNMTAAGKIEVYFPSFARDRTIELPENMKRIVSQSLGGGAPSFTQSSGDYLIFQTDPSDQTPLVIRLSDQHVFEVAE